MERYEAIVSNGKKSRTIQVNADSLMAADRRAKKMAEEVGIYVGQGEWMMNIKPYVEKGKK